MLRLKDQLEVPDASEKAPLSTCTATELSPTESEAVPETVVVPETVAPLAGEEMAAEARHRTAYSCNNLTSIVINGEAFSTP